METIVPEARGRAEALRTYLAGGGPLTRSGRYTQGRLKGKTIEQAQVEFDRKWGGASGRIKDKYANMAGNGAMSPSELADYETRVAGVRRSPAVAPVAAAPNPNKDLPTDERMHAEGKINPAPILPREAQTKPMAQMEPVGTVGVTGDKGVAGVAGVKNPRAVERQRQADEILAEAKTALDAEAKNQPTTGYTGPALDDYAAKSGMGFSKPGPVPKSSGPYVPPPREIAFDGRRNLGDSEAADAGKAIGQRVNPVTGLPFGYRPGDTLAPGANDVMRNTAAASVARQAAAVPTPQPKPMIQGVTKAPPTPGGPSLEEGWARDRRNEANKAAADKRIAANGNMGLKAGPIRPLAELVDPRALKPLAKPAPRVAGSKYSFARRM